MFLWVTPLAAEPPESRTDYKGDYCVGEYDAAQWLEFLRWGLCRDYVASIGKGLRSGAAVAGYRACLPDELTSSDMNFVVGDYLRQDIEREHTSPYHLVAAALSNAFPCRK